MNARDTQITILGEHFQPDALVRVVGVGLLASTYVNDTLLTAIVPAGLAKGHFNLRVTNPDGQSDTLEDAFEVAAPTSTPSITPLSTSTRFPTSTPLPTPTPFKRPLLFISSASTDPPSVMPEGSITVKLDIQNIGDTRAENTRVTFVSGALVPKGASGTQVISALGSGARTTVSQNLTLSGDVTTGIYQQQVILEYEDPNGISYSSTEVVGISVTIPEPGLPQIVIRGVRTMPDPIIPGEPFTLTLTLHNMGDSIARDVLLSMEAGGPAMPVGAGNTQSLDMLGEQGMKEVSQRLVVSKSTSGGNYSQRISIQYRDEEGTFHTVEQQVGLTVAETEEAKLGSRPRLSIASYRSEPNTLIPGEPFNLLVDVLNAGERPAKNIELALGSGKLSEDMSAGQTGLSSAPFAPLDTSNVKFISQLEAQTRTSVAQRMIVDGKAPSGVYVLEIGFRYYDDEGTAYTSGELVSLLVLRQPHLYVELYRPITDIVAGEPFVIPVELINIGQEAANVSTMELRSLDLEILEGSMYVGPLDPGTSSLLEAQAIAQQAGEAIAQVIINYLDDFGHPQQVIQELRFQVQASPTPLPTTEAGTTVEERPVLGAGPKEGVSALDRALRFLKALLGLGV